MTHQAQQDVAADEHPAAELELALRLSHLRAFVTVAEELHFTRAAERLFIAKPWLSAQIRKLESLYGVVLFERTTRRVTLTAKGEALRKYATAILAVADESWRDIRLTRSDDRQLLRIAYTPTIGDVRLVIDGLRRQLPSLRVMAEESWRDDATAGVLHGRFDIALVQAIQDEPQLHAHLIRADPLVITIGARHPLADADVVRVDDLATSLMVTWPSDICSRHPSLHDIFAANLELGQIYEYENASYAGFLSDPYAYQEMQAGRAFMPGFVPPCTEPPRGFVNRIAEPRMEMELYLLHKIGGRSVSTAGEDDPLDTVVALTRDLFARPEPAMVGGDR